MTEEKIYTAGFNKTEAYGKAQKVRHTKYDEPSELFFKKLAIVINDLNDKGIHISIDQDELPNLPNIKFLNPLAFALGTYVLQNDEIDCSKLNEAFNYANNYNKEYKVFKPDIIRYARFIRKF